MLILSRLNLVEYINRIERQKAVLEKSTIFTPTELVALLETYDLQLQLATAKLNRIDKIEIKKEVAKQHTLVFASNDGAAYVYIQKIIDKYANPFTVGNENAFNNNCIYIKNTTDIVAINNITNSAWLHNMLDSDIISTGKSNLHMIPFIVACKFDKKELTNELLQKCNIIDL